MCGEWVWALIGMGFLASYMANVLRMVVIVLVGYCTDTPGTDLQNMLLAHSYAGWIIFLGWVVLFWVSSSGSLSCKAAIPWNPLRNAPGGVGPRPGCAGTS